MESNAIAEYHLNFCRLTITKLLVLSVEICMLFAIFAISLNFAIFHLVGVI